MEGCFICSACLKRINIDEKIKTKGNVCKKCRAKKAREYVKNKKLNDKNFARKLSEAVSRSKAKNKELYAKINRRSNRKRRRNNKEKWNFWKRKNEQKHRDMISDRYLRSKKIPEELFEVKRAQIRLLRAVKNSKSTTAEGKII